MYNHNLIEKKWQKYWLEHKTFQFKDDSNKKFYALDMFPYPSGQGLHVGHPKGYTATDVVSRFKVHQGFDVLHPIGWDAFGLPAEQYALQTGNHPREFTTKNINHFREQLMSLGFCFDYDKEVNTTDPKYFKWTQWIFSKLFENNLAEIQDIDVNWCEGLGTVLSNEEVLIVDGKMVSERGSFPVVKRPMRQWVLKITKYADKLLDGLNEVDWPESLKSIQKKWIGKSVGALIKFKANDLSLDVFTTRPDTIYGVSYLAIAPESSLLDKLTSSQQKSEVEKYVAIAKSKTDVLRKQEKDKTGVFIGTYAINPITNKQIPIYVSDYVLKDHGTGIVMGVPAHDERDYQFAKKYNLPITFVIECENHNEAFTKDGIHINSELINGLNNKDASKTIIDYLTKNNLGKQHTTYKLKDWIFSRQRYWGEPFPIVFDENNKPTLVKELPIELPYIKNLKLSKTGESPLVNDQEWMNVNIDGKHYVRESNTMPQWAGSCWYYLGYILKQANGSYIDLNSKEAFELFKKWLPVDLYIGGQEHAVLHLLYARFWHRFLYDIKVVPTKEPFQKIINQGMILGENGEKMSKSRGNVINPDDIVKTHGADALRLYEMFMGPLTASLPWTESGLNGIRKWLDRVYAIFNNENIKICKDAKPNKDLEFAYNNFVKKVTNCIDKYNFNVGISEMMIFINECYKNTTLPLDYMINFLVVLSCYAPHLAEELYSSFNNESIFNVKWPTFSDAALVKSTVSLPISQNGKLRDVMEIDVNTPKDQVIEMAKSRDKVRNFIDGKQIKKIIYVPGKILNFIL